MISISKNSIKSVNNGLLLFAYIFNIAFIFLPGFLRTRMLIGAWGFLKSTTILKPYSKFIFNVSSLNLLFIILAIITLIITGNLAFWFIQHAALNIVYLFGGLYIARRFRSKNLSFEKFVFYIFITILIHNIITFIGFIIPPIEDFIINIQKDSESNQVLNQIIQFHSRSIGFGVGSFFLGGMISGLGIILNCYLINQKFLSPSRGCILLLLLLITGMFIARTSMLGLIGLIPLFLSHGKLKIGLIIKLLGVLSIAITLLIILYRAYLQDTISIDWAFEFIVNLLDSGNLETQSTNRLKEMWDMPDNAVTWIFGDGLFFNSDGSYYKHTDVGYLRIIYAIGVMGLIIFAINQIYLMITVVKLTPKHSDVIGLILTLAAYIAILNIKGFAEINFFFYLIIGFLMSTRQKNYQ